VIAAIIILTCMFVGGYAIGALASWIASKPENDDDE